MATYFIGIDGGGTKTDFLLVDGNGHMINRCQLGSSSYLSIGIDGLCQVLQSGVTELLTAASLNLTSICSIAIGVPSYGEIESDKKTIDQSITSLFPSIHVSIVNDVEVGFYASLGDRTGINLVAGTGSIGYAIDDNGLSARVGGWGEIIGDDGAGYWIGTRFLNAFSKMADGRLEPTLMYQVLKEQLEIKRDLNLLDHVYVSPSLRRTQIASFASMCDELAQQGDKTCQSILKQSAQELSWHIEALAKQLHFQPEQPIYISYSGSVFKSHLLLNQLQSLLGDRYQFHRPESEPVFGAVLLAKKL